MNRFLWLIRREIWEARVVWIAPLIVAAIVVGGAAAAGIWSHHVEWGMDGGELGELHSQLTPDRLDSIAAMMLASVSLPFLLLVVFTQFFYSIDSLYGERRDRSVLFWKSLPVSDFETVLSKLAVAALVMPVCAAAGAFIGQFGVDLVVALKLSSISGLQAHLWSPSVWASVITLDLYVALTSVFWYLPIVAYYLFVSALVPRAPLFWAALAPAALMLAERIVLGTHVIASTVFARTPTGLFTHIFGPGGADGLAFKFKKADMDLPHSLFSIMHPGDFLASPDVWVGIAVAVAFFAGAVWARRYRDQTN